jgi:hypothetical protein
MGYTHYWNKGTEKIDEDSYAKALKAMRKIVKANKAILANGAGDKDTSPDYIDGLTFNGIEGDSHESFSVPEKASEFERGDFCKTAMKPYDIVVVACLTVLHNYCPSMGIGSDGNADELEDGLKLAQKILKNKNLVHIYQEVPCNAEKFIESSIPKDKKTIPCSSEDNVCPHCGCESHHKEHTSYMLECAAYRIMDCGNCGKRFSNPYLLSFDEDRPEEDMEIEV